MRRLTVALSDRYRVDRELGAGGMATVYLAHDVKHDRDVAIKVLHPDLGAALGGERFLSEIRTTARLQHPHILPLLDSGEADGLLYYVMPLVTGETLRARLERERQLPIADAVLIAREVADALGYAHGLNVIHRDIKPENILLQNGHAVVADFGIALAVQSAGGQRMTQTGLSLGTPQYMSPEQAMGERTIDARSDIYALGAVTYEMLAGDAPFTGSSVQTIVAKVLTEKPTSLHTLRDTVPASVEQAVFTALAKLPADRFATAAEFSAALGNAGYTSISGSAARPAAPAPRGGRRAAAVAGAFALVAVAVAALGWFRPVPSAGVLRYDMQLPPVFVGASDQSQVPTPAPDGSFIVFLGPRTGRGPLGAQLWVKRRESHAAVPLAGTDDAQAFTISPDGAWVAFLVGNAVLKVPVNGGAPVTLARSEGNPYFGIAWLDDGTIVYTRGAPRLSVASVSSNGGASSLAWVVSDTAREAVVAAISGTRAVLFYRCIAFQYACDLWVGDLGTQKRTLVLKGVKWARYAESGHLVYAQDGRLMADEFDRQSFAVRGQPAVLADSITRGDSPFELSRSGTLVTRNERDTGAGAYEMVWIDRTGRATPVDSAWTFDITRYVADHGWALSPDGSRLAIGLYTDAGDDIWIKQLPGGPLSRITFDASPQMRPRWSADGRVVSFISASMGTLQHRADGLGGDSLLKAGVSDEAVLSPDGKWLVLRTGSNGSVAGGRDITGVRIGADTARVPLIVTPFDEEAIALSPDGKWIAYQSDETGRTEVFVRAFPNTSAFKHQVSNGGGTAPLWSRDGRELFFVSPGADMMSARVTAGAPIAIAAPAPLFHIADDLLKVEYTFYTPWDVAADGRFIMARARGGSAGLATSVVIAENWLTELRARMKR
ncbi:protein kinase [Gemmatimonas sp.]|uniref:protein kinase domain-containing protein n=1 Tax=Gemmatimonas sp. TaxID=1962908 RepID=UPI00286B9C6A|nr:protein kinase [Gemmatimonas sp.]